MHKECSAAALLPPPPTLPPSSPAHWSNPSWAHRGPCFKYTQGGRGRLKMTRVISEAIRTAPAAGQYKRIWLFLTALKTPLPSFSNVLVCRRKIDIPIAFHSLTYFHLVCHERNKGQKRRTKVKNLKGLGQLVRQWTSKCWKVKNSCITIPKSFLSRLILVIFPIASCVLLLFLHLCLYPSIFSLLTSEWIFIKTKTKHKINPPKVSLFLLSCFSLLNCDSTAEYVWLHSPSLESTLPWLDLDFRWSGFLWTSHQKDQTVLGY